MKRLIFAISMWLCCAAVSSLSGMEGSARHIYTPAEVLERGSVRDAGVLQGLNAFFGQADVRECLGSYRRTLNIGNIHYHLHEPAYVEKFGKGLEAQLREEGWALSSQARAILDQGESWTSERLSAFIGQMWVDGSASYKQLARLCKKYDIANVGSGAVCVLVSNKFWPGKVVKIGRVFSNDNYDGRFMRQQNVSRAFYNLELNDFIASEGLEKYFYRLEERLYRLPGVPMDAPLNDENFVIVSDRVPCELLISGAENRLAFSRLVVMDDDIELEDGTVPGRGVKKIVAKMRMVRPFAYCADFFEAFMRVTQAVGLWDHSWKNTLVLLPDDGTSPRAILVDTERPAYGGGQEQYFYHLDDGELQANARCGDNWIDDAYTGFVQQVIAEKSK